MHDVVARQQLARVVGVEPLGMRHARRRCGLSAATNRPALSALRAADARGAVDRSGAAGCESETVSSSTTPMRADTRRREIGDHRAAEPAGADHQHPRRLQLLLALAADALEHEMAGVALGFFGLRASSASSQRHGEEAPVGSLEAERDRSR